MKTLILSLLFSSIAFADPITVAVLDTGIDFNHSMFKNKLIYDNRNNLIPDHAPDLMDENGHGTHIASIVLRYSYGVANIFPLKMAHPDNRYISTMASANDPKDLYVPEQLRMYEAIGEAIAAGIKVINISSVEPEQSDETEAAIRVARRFGIIIVAAAGNGNLNLDNRPMYPCSYSINHPNVVCVGSIQGNGSNIQRTHHNFFSGSNYGKAVTVYANGNWVVGAQLHNNRLDKNDFYMRQSGTSQSTAKISGLIANELFRRQIRLLNIPSMNLYINIKTDPDFKEVISSVLFWMKKDNELAKDGSQGLYLYENETNQY